MPSIRRGAGAGRRGVVGAAFLVWTLVVGVQVNDQGVSPGIVLVVLAAGCAVGTVVLTRLRREGLAFAATGATIVLAVILLFTELYPRVMVSSTDFANSLTISNASSGHYTLTVMSIVALVLLPVILLYQAWSYHVFRVRLGTGEARRRARSNSSRGAVAKRRSLREAASSVGRRFGRQQLKQPVLLAC